MALIIFMAIALSMDAFSIALIVGVIDKKAYKYYLFSIVVGIFHFIFPLLGALTDYLLLNKFVINGNRLLGIILILLGIQVFLDIKKEYVKINSASLILLAFSVSIDSYFAGIGLKSLNNFNVLYLLVFSLFSFSLSILGCKIGKKGKENLGKTANLIGGFILLILGVKYLLFN